MSDHVATSRARGARRTLAAQGGTAGPYARTADTSIANRMVRIRPAPFGWSRTRYESGGPIPAPVGNAPCDVGIAAGARTIEPEVA